MSDKLRINGITHSWGSTKLKIAGERYSGISSISYGDKLETSFGYGMGKSHAPRSQSRGKYTTEQTVIKCEVNTAEQIRIMLANKSPGGKSYGFTMVPIILQYLEPGDKPVNIRLEKCRLVEDMSSDEEGSDVLTVELKWTTFRIYRNGKTLFEIR